MPLALCLRNQVVWYLNIVPVLLQGRHHCLNGDSLLLHTPAIIIRDQTHLEDGFDRDQGNSHAPRDPNLPAPARVTTLMACNADGQGWQQGSGG